MSDSYMNVFNDTENVSRFNFSGTTKQVLNRVIMFISLRLTLDKQTERDVLQGTIDLCKLVNGTVGNFYLKYFLTHIEDKTNFNFKCPVAVNTYYIRNFKSIDDRFIPFWIVGDDIKWAFKVIFKGKMGKMKSMIWLGELTVNGTVSRV